MEVIFWIKIFINLSLKTMFWNFQGEPKFENFFCTIKIPKSYEKIGIKKVQ